MDFWNVHYVILSIVNRRDRCVARATFLHPLAQVHLVLLERFPKWVSTTFVHNSQHELRK